MKTYRGSPAAARHYVEADRGRADDYYLAEGAGIAERYSASPTAGVSRLAPLNGEAYEAWVAGLDPDTGVPKGRLRNDDNAVRFVEVVVNGPKSWSLAAELHPDISAAYDAAQDRAATQIIGWLAQHATTRIGPRGAQVQVPVAVIEAVTVRHHTSRTGDPHRHLHLQINVRVVAEGRWRGLHTVGVRDSLDAINGIGHAAVMTDPGFRAALAGHGFTLDAGTGEISELAEFVGPFSARAAQIGRNVDRYESEWRAANPGHEPGPHLRRSWDARAWGDARPDKITPRNGTELAQRWVTELRALGYRDSPQTLSVDPALVGELDRGQAVEEVLTRLAARRSGWNAADIRGEVELLIARRNVVTDAQIRAELAEDLTARTRADCVPLLNRPIVPEHIRALTSRRVLDVEIEIAGRLATRAGVPDAVTAPAFEELTVGLDPAQRAAVATLSSHRQLVVIEGAAGVGKTTTLAATRTALERAGRQLVVVTPTLKAARVAAEQLGSAASSAAWLAHQHGYRWSEAGAWTRLRPGQLDPTTGLAYTAPSDQAALRAGDLLLVDEAGMLDQDTARALVTIADEHGARLALMGDRHQLPAIGRGGVLDLAARWAWPDACLTLDTVHRFTHTTTQPDGTTIIVPDPEYALLSLAMRTATEPDQVFDALLDRDQIRIHPTEQDRTQTLATETERHAGAGGEAIVAADTREQVAALNAAIRERLVAAGQVDDQHATATSSGQRIGPGDRVATRRNDHQLQVANRDTWTVLDVAPDGHVTVEGEHGKRTLPADYVRDHLELAYATTIHGVQGDTATVAHVLIGAHTTAAAAYVGLTRGRESNVAHLVADTVEDAREQWAATFSRDRADLGPAHAAQRAAAEADRYATGRPLDQALADLHRAWRTEADCLKRLTTAENSRDALRELVPLRAEHDTILSRLRTEAEQAWAAEQHADARLTRLQAAITADTDRGVSSLTRQWDQQRPAARTAAQTIHAGTGRLGLRRGDVRQAREQLQQWGDAWRPIVPGLPAEPARLAEAATWFDDSTQLHQAFDRAARQAAQRAHPDYQPARQAAQTAHQARTAALAARREANKHSNSALSQFGPLAHIPNPQQALERTEHDITATRDQLEQTRADITALTGEPALRSLPIGRLETERATWTQHRASQALLDRVYALTPHPAPRRHQPAPQLSEPAPTRGVQR